MNSLSNEERDKKSKDLYESARVIKQDTPEQLNKVLNLLRNALQLNPCFINALILRASALMKASDFHSALSDLSLAIHLERAQTPLDKRRLALFHGNRASLWLALGSFKDMQNDLCEAAELEPDNGGWLYELGFQYHRQGNLFFAKRLFTASLQPSALLHMSSATQYKNLLSLATCCIADEPDRALEILTKAKAINETAVLQNLTALAFYRKGNFKLATQNFVAALEKDPHNTVYHTRLALTWFSLGQAEDAQRHLNEAIFRNSPDALLLFYRGCLNLEMGLPHRSLVDFDEAIRIKPEPRFFHAKGASFIEQGKKEEARDQFLKVLSMEPDHRPSLICLGLIAHDEKKLYEALKYFHAALELSSDDACVLHRVGIVYAELDHHTAAIRFFRQCCRLEPKDGKFRFHLAVAHLDRGDPQGALDAITSAVDELRYEKPMAAYIRSNALYQLQKIDCALHWINKAIEWGDKDGALFFLHRSFIKLGQRKFQECVEDASRALLETEPKSKSKPASQLRLSDRSQAHYLRAQAYFSLGNLDDTLKDLHAAAELQKGLAEHPIFNYTLGVTFASAGSCDEAQKAFTASIDTATSMLSEARSRTNEIRERSASPVHSTLILTHHERAKVRQSLGDTQGALDDFDIVIKAQPENRNALLRRSFALKMLGQFECSSRDWQRAMSLSMDDDDIDRETLFEAWMSEEVPFVELCLPGEEEGIV